MSKARALPADRSFVPAFAESLAGAVLPGDGAFAKPALAEAARLVADAAALRPDSDPTIAIETVSGPVGERLMRIAAINDDMPFLVDSLAATIAAQGLTINRLLHPVIAVRRNSQGRIIALPDDDTDGEKRESIIYIETPRIDAKARTQLRRALEVTLHDVQAAVADWPKLRDAMVADADGMADPEGAALLRWFSGGMLTQLGHVVRHRDGSQAGALGICRTSGKALLSPASYERAFAWFQRKGGGTTPLIVKSNLISNVHRRVLLDLFIVPKLEHGKVTALSVHAGVWTSAALVTSPDRVPRLRAGLSALMERLDFDPAGHAGKSLFHALTALPHDLLIGFTPADLERVAIDMVSLVDRPRPKLALVLAPLKRHLFAFVWLPRDAVSTNLRRAIWAMLEQAADAPVLDWAMQVEEGNLALIRFVLDMRDGGKLPDTAALDAQLCKLVRGWSESVEAELARHDPGRAAVVAARYAEAFPLAYRTSYGPAEAALDIARLRRLPGEEDAASLRRTARFHRMPGDGEEQLRLKLYQRRGALALSDAVPALENFGFRVIEDVPTALDGGRLGAIHDFLLQPPAGRAAQTLLDRAEAVEEAISAVLNGEAEDDAFNRLIVASGLSAREADWLRAWYRYLRQAGLNYTVVTAVEALERAPAVTRGIIDLFHARHYPRFNGDRHKAEKQAQREIHDGLAKVAAINHDRLLRQYRALVEAMLRTNAFVETGREALAFKLNSALVPGLPRPVPWREVFVCSRRVEGIHLRAGPIARGGIRWSDRRDDFRTEVLGLMKAQRVKNAVIVPTGAKGGFYPKRLPDPQADRDAWLAEGKQAYCVFIRALLSLTDNIVGAKVVHPRGVIVRDGDDPYFVVAADKGTASYSDTANALAEEHDFWLDDAFASGGSKGYDHKAMGITARGAWLSVRRHFLELGVDVQSQPVRVAGCGDMSGDVFGNGMLLSKAIKLVAAFDHRHVFIDPDPDPAKSWAERGRLFALPRSSWDDYDRKLISRGGGVWPRSLKAIPLSKEARAVLGIEAESADPETLISAILRCPVDLLWFGGIGTYVKATAENNVQVGDPANDGLRVNGSEIRARVIGEGANLGCTQAGRIEFALLGNAGAGGRLNTDFIDNSAGVDCSDKEVNIKIALAAAKRAGRLSERSRVALLERMTDDVAELVLEDNRLQALALSIARLGGPDAAGPNIRLIEMLEERGQLDRRTEGLADNDVLLRRAMDGEGLTRPELAVLLSSAKLALQTAIEESSLPDDPGLDAELLAAFPAAMRGKFRREILAHRLRREIIATRIANRLVNRIGMIHPFELVEEEGATLAHVAAAFVATEQLFGLDTVWSEVESAPMNEGARLMLLRRIASAQRMHMADAIRAGLETGAPSRLVKLLRPGIESLSARREELLRGEARAQSQRLRRDWAAAGAPPHAIDLAAGLADLDGAVGLARLATDLSLDPASLTAAFAAIGESLGLDWAQQVAARMRPADPWERLLVAGLARDFLQMRLDFLKRLACAGRTGRPRNASALPGECRQWIDRHADAVHQFRSMIARGQAALAVSPAMLGQIAGQARNLLSR